MRRVISASELYALVGPAEPTQGESVRPRRIVPIDIGLKFKGVRYSVSREKPSRSFSALLDSLYGRSGYSLDIQPHLVTFKVPKDDVAGWINIVGRLKNLIFGGTRVEIRSL